ncbi:unnamed protein product, partial [Ectocarpus sp. 8 AP-2014]
VVHRQGCEQGAQQGRSIPERQRECGRLRLKNESMTRGVFVVSEGAAIICERLELKDRLLGGCVLNLVLFVFSSFVLMPSSTARGVVHVHLVSERGTNFIRNLLTVLRLFYSTPYFLAFSLV